MKNKRKIWVWVLVVLFLMLLIVAVVYLLFFNKPLKGKKESKVTPTPVKSQYTITSPELSDFDLYFLKLEDEDKNVIYSPLSIKYALAMLKEGADGKTKSQIDSLIGDYEPKVYPNNQNMSFGNALFIRNTYQKQIKKSYIDNIKDKYNADIVYDDFKSPKVVNDWIRLRTFKLIENMLDDVSTFDFILVNALAIDMEWINKIQPTNGWDISYNHEKYFNYVDMYSTEYYPDFIFNDQNAISSKIGASINKYDIIKELGEDNIRKTLSDEYDKWLKDRFDDTPLEETKEETINRFIKELNENYGKMSSSTDFTFYDDEKVKIFAKDLKTYDNTTLEYIGIMPKNEELESFINNNKAKDINNLINKLQNVELDTFEEGYITEITGHIPLFEYEYELKLVEDLNTLGIKDVFDSNKADLSKMSKTDAFISDAKHKAIIEFSNDGIKAAAATMAGGKGSTGGSFEYLFEVPVKKIDLSFDKPYMYIIRDKKTGEVWFAGKVFEPTKNVTN